MAQSTAARPAPAPAPEPPAANSPLEELARIWATPEGAEQPCTSFRLASNWIVPQRSQVWPAHRHRDHEMLWGVDGVVTAEVDGVSFTVPAHHGLWIPAGSVHRVLNLSATRLVCSWFAVDDVPWRVSAPATVPISPLLRAVLEHLRIEEDLTEESARRWRNAEAFAFDLLGGELRTAWSLPLPQDAALRRLAEAMQANPSAPWDVAAAAVYARVSQRTLRRRFVADTGVTFAQWRLRMRVGAATAMLAGGETVATVARSLGYRSPSAFTEAYRRVTGQPPAAHARSART